MRIREIIAEYDRSITLRTTEQKLSARIASDRLAPDTVDEIMEMIESVDPTPQNTYTPWLVNQYIKNSFNISDLESVKSIMSKYHAVKKYIPAHDIGQLSLEQIKDMAEKGEAKKAAPLDVIPDTEILYNGPQGQLAIPKTMEASIALGEGTVWCTAWDPIRGNQFNNYNLTGDLYIWRDAKRKDKKYQFYWGNAIQFMDRANDPLSEKDMKYFREINPITAPIFAREEAKILKSNNETQIKKLFSVLKKSGVDLLSSKEFVLSTPVNAFMYANDIRSRFPEGESIIATDPKYAYKYVVDIINQNNWGKGIRWPEGEKAIATDAEYAYKYAVDIINQYNQGESIRWPEGEKAIATDAEYAYKYSEKIINQYNKGAPIRWPEGEKAIATDAEYAYKYAINILKNRFHEGEKAIANSTAHAFTYVKDVINRYNKGKPTRWPEGEAAIATNAKSAFWYAKYILNSRFPEGESAIKNSSLYNDYTKDVINGLWGKGYNNLVNAIKTDPKQAYNYAVETNHTFPAGEAAIATSAKWAYLYNENVRSVIEDGKRRFFRWPEAEAAIATDPEWAYKYNMNVRGVIENGKRKIPRWSEAEAAIATDPEWAYKYSIFVLSTRFPAGEKAIASDPTYAKQYDQLFGTNLSQQ